MIDHIARLERSDVGWRALAHEQEHRAFASLDWVERRDTDSTVTFRGYASVFNVDYDVAGLFTERVDQRAFNATLRNERKIHLLANHGGLPLASTQSGTLRLRSDDHGLAVLADLDLRSPYAQSVASAVERGDMDEMSFGFRAIEDRWSDDYAQRTLLELQLLEVSVVPRGANPATSAGLDIEDVGDDLVAAVDPQPRSYGFAKQFAVLQAGERIRGR